MLGMPCSIEFKSKLKNIYKYSQENIIREIVYYFVMKEIYDLPHIPKDSEFTLGDVPPSNILRIEEIPNFIEEQEKNDKYLHFYD